ncbi:MAG: glycosyltransferase family 4 protein [Planctomycetes bacterium]|nr:glycosyltransferase family 4 protein [Planctomycetota bacterium]MCC7172862.1 glycosyltransferase family 4 protein [Planctomycetota bacterium]
MKILYHHRTASRDGQEVHITELVGALRGLGHEVRVVSPSGGDDGGGAMGGNRGGLARLRALVPDALMPLAARAYEFVFTRRLVREGRAFCADVLYERHALFNHCGVRAAAKLGVPLLLEVNSPLAREEQALRHLEDADAVRRDEVATIARADAVFAVTGVLKRILVEDGVPQERVHVVQNGVDPVRFFAPRDPDAKRAFGVAGKLVLGFIGFPRPWHGLDRVVRVLARSPELANAVLLVGGEGPAIAPLLELARELGVADRVVVHGVVDRNDVPRFLDAFDVALQPKATPYASPLKLFEYLARGCAVIAPAQANITEVVADGDSAALFTEDDDVDFARVLLRVCSDAAWRARLAARGPALIVERGLTWPGNAAKVAAVARALLDRRAARGAGR